MNSPLNEVLGIPEEEYRRCSFQCSNCGGTIMRAGRCESCGHDDVAVRCYDGSDWYTFPGNISTYYAGEVEACRIVERFASYGLPSHIPPFYAPYDLSLLHEHYTLVAQEGKSPGWTKSDVASVVVYGVIEADVVLSIKRKQTKVTFVNAVTSKLAPISFFKSFPISVDGGPDYKGYIKRSSKDLILDPGNQLSLWLSVTDGLGNANRLNVSLVDPIVTAIQHRQLSSGQDKNCYQIVGRIWGQVDVSQ
jgi:hypothetical protein